MVMLYDFLRDSDVTSGHLRELRKIYGMMIILSQGGLIYGGGLMLNLHRTRLGDTNPTSLSTLSQNIHIRQNVKKSVMSSCDGSKIKIYVVILPRGSARSGRIPNHR